MKQALSFFHLMDFNNQALIVKRVRRCLNLLVRVLQLSLFFIAVSGYAQNDSMEQYLLTTKSSVVELGSVNIIDPYFTITEYSGTLLGYRQQTARLFSAENRDWSMQTQFAFNGGYLNNPTKTGEMFYASYLGGWGVNYHFRVNNKLMFLAGGLGDVQIGLKELPRYINNPFNMDLSLNLNLTGTAYWDFMLFRYPLRMVAIVESPVFGGMFVPAPGASYYEMFQLGNLKKAFHVSSLNNRAGLTQTYKLQIPLNRFSIQAGLRWQYLKYKANDMVFKNNQLSLVLGVSLDQIRFGGRKRQAPSNFLNATY